MRVALFFLVALFVVVQSAPVDSSESNLRHDPAGHGKPGPVEAMPAVSMENDSEPEMTHEMHDDDKEEHDKEDMHHEGDKHDKEDMHHEGDKHDKEDMHHEGDKHDKEDMHHEGDKHDKEDMHHEGDKHDKEDMHHEGDKHDKEVHHEDGHEEHEEGHEGHDHGKEESHEGHDEHDSEESHEGHDHDSEESHEGHGHGSEESDDSHGSHGSHGSHDSDEDTPEPSSEEEDGVCIGATHLKAFGSHELVFKKHVLARVLCDVSGSCATHGHIVNYKGNSMMMGSYCDIVGCEKKIMEVNSPRYQRGLKVQSESDDMHFTAFAARFETRGEEAVLAAAVRVGL